MLCDGVPSSKINVVDRNGCPENSVAKLEQNADRLVGEVKLDTEAVAFGSKQLEQSRKRQLALELLGARPHFKEGFDVLRAWFTDVARILPGDSQVKLAALRELPKLLLELNDCNSGAFEWSNIERVVDEAVSVCSSFVAEIFELDAATDKDLFVQVLRELSEQEASHETAFAMGMTLSTWIQASPRKELDGSISVILASLANKRVLSMALEIGGCSGSNLERLGMKILNLSRESQLDLGDQMAALTHSLRYLPSGNVKREFAADLLGCLAVDETFCPHSPDKSTVENAWLSLFEAATTRNLSSSSIELVDFILGKHLRVKRDQSWGGLRPKGHYNLDFIHDIRTSKIIAGRAAKSGLLDRIGECFYTTPERRKLFGELKANWILKALRTDIETLRLCETPSTARSVFQERFMVPYQQLLASSWDDGQLKMSASMIIAEALQFCQLDRDSAAADSSMSLLRKAIRGMSEGPSASSVRDYWVAYEGGAVYANASPTVDSFEDIGRAYFHTTVQAIKDFSLPEMSSLKRRGEDAFAYDYALRMAQHPMAERLLDLHQQIVAIRGEQETQELAYEILRAKGKRVVPKEFYGEMAEVCHGTKDASQLDEQHRWYFDSIVNGVQREACKGDEGLWALMLEQTAYIFETMMK